MIHIVQAPEPNNFDAFVRKRGIAYLEANNVALDAIGYNDFEPYWQACLPTIDQVYQSTCAYFGIRLSLAAGGCTVDHYLSKRLNPAILAYEWSNYRYASTRANSRKGQKSFILDPFLVQDDWFNLDLQSGVLSCSSLVNDSALRSLIERNIGQEGLNLNSDELLQERRMWWQLISEGRLAASALASLCPIVYRQGRLQGLVL